MRTRLILAALSLFLSKNRLSSPSPPDPLDAAPSRFATYDGAKVHYRSFGDPAAKTAVVFVHGWSCDMTSWRAQVPAFEGKARVLLVDLPGHGKSDRPAVDYTMERFANAVETVMRDAGVERALLVGHSMGTPVVRLFARLYPRKTLGLVAVDGALRTHMTDPEAIRKFTSSFAAPKFRESLEGFFELVLTPTTPETVKTEVRAMMRSASPHVAASAMKEMFDPAVWTDDPIGVPLQVIVAKSPMWNADYFAYVKKLNPSAEIHEVPDSGHFVMMEKPTEVNALLLAFASKTGVVSMRAVRPGRPEDVSSPEAIVKAVYDVISGPAGKDRDWGRFPAFDGTRWRVVTILWEKESETIVIPEKFLR